MNTYHLFRQSRIFLLLLVLGLWTTTVLADNREKFNSAYTAYQEHINAGQTDQALEAANDAYRYGSKVFGRNHVNTANLAINYAILLNDTGDHRKARKTLKGKLDILEKRYGENATNLVPLFMQLGRAAKDADATLEYLHRAASLSKGYEDNLDEAEKNFDIMVILLNRDSESLVEPFVDRAYEIYAERLQPNDFRLGLMSYHKARWATSKNQHDDTTDYLLRALQAFQRSEGPMGGLERSVRLQLVQAYEKLNQPKEATEQLLILGANQSWFSATDPVYQPSFKFPEEAIAKRINGEVSLSFTIDEQGFVVNPSVTESSEEIFNDAALEMVRGFRYIPRFVDGKPVATEGIVYDTSFVFSNPVASRGQFQRPPIKEMMLPDEHDISMCFGGDIVAETTASCQKLPWNK